MGADVASFHPMPEGTSCYEMPQCRMAGTSALYFCFINFWRNEMIIATKILASAILLALIAPAQASYFAEVEANDTLAQAQSMDPYFSLDFDPDIGDINGVNWSTTILHASVIATGDSTYDYYSFTLSSDYTVILDIDYGMPAYDSEIGLWKADGTYITENDDHFISVGAGGSEHSYDSFIQIPLQAGSYIVGVAKYYSNGNGGNIGWDANSNVIPIGADYTLHVSVGTVPEAETYAMMLAGLGLVGFTASRRKLAK